jgi:transposase
MTQTTRDLKTELDKSVVLLRTLRDEVRLQLHLGSMDAKDEWRRLEPRLESAFDQAAKEVTEASRTVVEEATAALQRFKKNVL